MLESRPELFSGFVLRQLCDHLFCSNVNGMAALWPFFSKKRQSVNFGIKVSIACIPEKNPMLDAHRPQDCN